MSDTAAIFQIISSLSSSLTLEEILADFTQKTADYLGVDSCAILRWEQERQSLVVLADTKSPEMAPTAEGVDQIGAAYPLAHYPATTQILDRQTPLVVYAGDPAADEAETRLLISLGWGAALMAPMVYKEQSIGLLKLYTKDKDHLCFTDENIHLSQAIANQAAVAIENSRLYEETEEARLYAETMQVVSRILASELDYHNIINTTANFAYRLVYAQFVYIAIPAEETFRPLVMVGRGNRDTAAIRYNHTPLNLPGQEILAQATQRPVFISDIQEDPTFASAQKQAEIDGWRTLIAVPLLSYDEIVGILTVYADQPNFFKPNDVAVLMSLASQAAVAIQNARLFAELEAQRKELRQVSLRLVNAQEEERRRISRELHDEMGQALTALKINLDLARRALPPEPPELLQTSIQEASALAKHTLESARNLSLELHPAILNDLGLVAALRWELDRYEQRLQKAVQFEADLADTALQPELEITIYRIITEALTNVARHAQAERISVQLVQESHQVTIEVQDNGVGFDAESWLNSPNERQSLGLTGMRERAQILGGRLNIVSMPDQGTKIWAQLPLDS